MPPLFKTLVQVLALADTMAATWWRSVWSSQWSNTIEWRRAMLHFDLHTVPHQGLDAVLPAWEGELLRPKRLIAILEDLVAERRLSRTAASTISEAVLVRLDAQGRWRLV